jgi:hypothetical protein
MNNVAALEDFVARCMDTFYAGLAQAQDLKPEAERLPCACRHTARALSWFQHVRCFSGGQG